MRALLVVNPRASATTPGVRDVLIRALGSELKLDAVTTTHRGHARELAAEAVADGLELVVTLGGDGTVNEVVNGLLGDGPDGATSRPPVPALAVVPGGGANVFARSLGLPRDPVEATSVVLTAVRADRRRRLGLGRANGRWFTFCAGFGFDAEVVRAVERQRQDGARSSTGRYVRAALAEFYLRTDRRTPAIHLERPGAETVDHVFLAIVSNASPWTFAGSRALHPSPAASYDTGLDVLAMRRLTTLSTGRTVRQLLASDGRAPRGRVLLGLHDVARFRLRADRPTAAQVDGEYLGKRTSLEFTAVPGALQVIC